MTKDEMTALAERQLQAYNRGDLDAFCACYHPEVSVRLLISDVQSDQGMQAFRESFRKLFESAPELKCELKSRIVVNAAVIDEEWVTGAPKYPNGFHAVAIYGFRDGLIDRIWFTR